MIKRIRIHEFILVGVLVDINICLSLASLPGNNILLSGFLLLLHIGHLIIEYQSCIQFYIYKYSCFVIVS